LRRLSWKAAVELSCKIVALIVAVEVKKRAMWKKTTVVASWQGSNPLFSLGVK
jgi:hypothetical protein